MPTSCLEIHVVAASILVQLKTIVRPSKSVLYGLTLLLYRPKFNVVPVLGCVLSLLESAPLLLLSSFFFSSISLSLLEFVPLCLPQALLQSLLEKCAPLSSIVSFMRSLMSNFPNPWSSKEIDSQD